MDLPTCPSCGQSVLDDDATDCPFCGASMSGKPSSKPAPASAAATAKATATKAKEEKKAADDDDPFEVSAPVTGKSIPLSPKPVKGRLHRVVCPMCEMPGFSSKKAAGKQVRCANKECMVPIFTAPPLEGETEEAPRSEEIPKEKNLLIPIIIGVVLVMGGGGGYLYMEASKPTDTEDGPLNLPPENPNAQTVAGTDNGESRNTTGQNGNNDATQNGNGTQVEDKGPTVAELHKQVPELMVQFSRDREAVGRKPECRRKTAEAFALAGDFEGLQGQLAQLDRIASSRPHLKLSPSVMAAWQHLSAGNKAEAEALANQAVTLLGSIRQQGASRTRSATQVATLLVALGKQGQAVEVFEERTNTKQLGQLLESMARVQVVGSFNLDEAVRLRPTVGWSAPQWVAVTVGLSARGHLAEALAWAKSAPSSQAIRDCLAAWAETQILTGQSKEAAAAIEQEIAERSPADRTWILSRVALHLGSNGDSDGAVQMLTKARAALAEAGTPSPAPFPDLKQRCSLQLPDSTPMRDAAIAATELAHAEALLEQGDAWKTIEQAQEFARAMAPSPSVTAGPVTEMNNSQDAVRAQIKQELKLLTDNEVMSAFAKYRTNCTNLNDAAIARFQLQADIVTAALDWGLADQAWESVKGRLTNIDPTAVEPWQATTVLHNLHERFRVGGQTATMQAVLGAVPGGEFAQQAKNRRLPVELRSANLIADGQVSEAARRLSQISGLSEDDANWLRELVIRLACRQVAAGKTKQALQYVRGLTDTESREMALTMIAAQSTAAGDRKTAFAAGKDVNLTPPDRVALLRGFVAGLPKE